MPRMHQCLASWLLVSFIIVAVMADAEQATPQTAGFEHSQGDVVLPRELGASVTGKGGSTRGRPRMRSAIAPFFAVMKAV